MLATKHANAESHISVAQQAFTGVKPLTEENEDVRFYFILFTRPNLRVRTDQMLNYNKRVESLFWQLNGSWLTLITSCGASAVNFVGLFSRLFLIFFYESRNVAGNQTFTFLPMNPPTE